MPVHGGDENEQIMRGGGEWRAVVVVVVVVVGVGVGVGMVTV